MKEQFSTIYPDDLFTDIEAARFIKRYLGINYSTSTLKKIRSQNLGPKHCRVGKYVRYPKKELEKYVRDAFLTYRVEVDK